MKRVWIMLPLLSLTVGGCAIVSGTPSGDTAAARSSYEPMESQPPAAQSESVPQLEAREVWVPGYYQPAAGTWLWHPGQVTAQKDGYRLVPASYFQQAGKTYFTPPRWRRADLAPMNNTELSANK